MNTQKYRYDFTDAIKELRNYDSPQQLSTMLKDATISTIAATEEETLVVMFRRLCDAVDAACNVLDKIKVEN